jgi:hypothetical protein
MMISNYASTWPIDHDDGSCYWHDSFNLLLYGGAKNYLGHSKKSLSNVYVHVELNPNGYAACYTDYSPNAFDEYSGNKCIVGSGPLYSWKCNPSSVNATVDISAHNQVSELQV